MLSESKEVKVTAGSSLNNEAPNTTSIITPEILEIDISLIGSFLQYLATEITLSGFQKQLGELLRKCTDKNSRFAIFSKCVFSLYPKAVRLGFSNSKEGEEMRTEAVAHYLVATALFNQGVINEETVDELGGVGTNPSSWLTSVTPEDRPHFTEPSIASCERALALLPRNPELVSKFIKIRDINLVGNFISYLMTEITLPNFQKQLRELLEKCTDKNSQFAIFSKCVFRLYMKATELDFSNPNKANEMHTEAVAHYLAATALFGRGINMGRIDELGGINTNPSNWLVPVTPEDRLHFIKPSAAACERALELLPNDLALQKAWESAKATVNVSAESHAAHPTSISPVVAAATSSSAGFLSSSIATHSAVTTSAPTSVTTKSSGATFPSSLTRR